jgi:hypothetical protein
MANGLGIHLAVRLTLTEPIHDGGVVMIFLKPSLGSLHALGQTQYEMITFSAQ